MPCTASPASNFLVKFSEYLPTVYTHFVKQVWIQYRQRQDHLINPSILTKPSLMDFDFDGIQAAQCWTQANRHLINPVMNLTHFSVELECY